jgi:hypothetical protein
MADILENAEADLTPQMRNLIDRLAAELIMARRDVLHSKAEYIAEDLSIAQTFFLAVLRRTIHWRYSCPKVRTAIRIRWSILLAVMARCDG